MINTTGLVHNVLMGLTENVFGSVTLTVSVLMVGFVLLALLVRIPLPFAFGLNIPVAVVFTAFGYLTPLIGGLLTVGFLALAIFSLLVSLAVKS